jgi:hypothetical protein
MTNSIQTMTNSIQTMTKTPTKPQPRIPKFIPRGGKKGYCLVCRSEKKDLINVDVLTNKMSYHAVSRKYGIDRVIISRHIALHINDMSRSVLIIPPKPPEIAWSVPAVDGNPTVGTIQEAFSGLSERLKSCKKNQLDQYIKGVIALGNLAIIIYKGMEYTLSLTSRRLSLEQGQADPLSKEQIKGINEALATHSIPDGIGEIMAGVLKSINPDGSIDSASRIRAVSAIADIVRPKY